MNRRALLSALFFAPVAAAPVWAIPLPEPAARLHWECVPFARAVSGIQIFGDAYLWWNQADGRYKRGNKPRIGAVLSFIPHGRMELGHVATVSRIIDDRTVLVTHANWSPINGRRGQIERDVEVVDVSDDGDWTAVRVWFAPSQALGTTAWPTHGFIYPAKSANTGKAEPRLAYADITSRKPSTRKDGMPTGRLTYLGKILRAGK